MSQELEQELESVSGLVKLVQPVISPLELVAARVPDGQRH